MVWTTTPDDKYLCDECSEVLEPGDEVITTRQGKILENGRPEAEFHNIYHRDCAPKVVRKHKMPEQIEEESS